MTPTRSARTCVVSPDGAGEYRTLAEALLAAPAGARIVVRPGIYPEPLVVQRAVEIVGDGPAEDVVLQCADDACLIADHVLSGVAVTAGSSATLRGTTLSGNGKGFSVHEDGRAEVRDCDLRGNRGGPWAIPLAARLRRRVVRANNRT